jgi:hypothetical protein
MGYFPAGLSSTDPNLCAAGTLTTFQASTSYAPYYYFWICGGSGSGPSNWCWAYNTPGALNGACGSASGVPSLTPPAANLCATGTWTSVTQDATGTNWLWTCQGATGGAAANCSAPVKQPLANGACGTATGTAIPNAPNFNLCSSGTPGTLNGAGPWTWTCLGTGGGTDSGLCKAFLCNACTGTITTSNSALLSGNSGGCHINATANWTETDNLVAGGASTLTMTWTDLFGGFSKTVSPAAAPWPTYCPPCFKELQSVSGVAETVTSASGSCGSIGVGSSLPVSGVTVY